MRSTQSFPPKTSKQKELSTVENTTNTSQDSGGGILYPNLLDNDDNDDYSSSDETESYSEQSFGKVEDRHGIRSRTIKTVSTVDYRKYERSPSRNRQSRLSPDDSSSYRTATSDASIWDNYFYKFCKHDRIRQAFIPIALIIVVFLFVLIGYYMLFSAPTKLQKLETLRNKMHTFVQTDFKANRRLSAILTYVGEMLVNGTAKFPIVILVAGEQKIATKFAENYSKLLVEFWPHNLTNFSVAKLLKNASRRDLESAFFGDFHANRVLLLGPIEQLQEPLFLHSISDPDSSPFLRALIILTMDLEQLRSRSTAATDKNKDCAELITKNLLRKWITNRVTEDQIYPILSRISAHSICLY